MNALRQILAATCLCAAASLTAAFPIAGKPIRILVGVPPGGGTDIGARIVAERLQALTGVPVLVENRPGAGFTIAAAEVARAAPDGHTILFTPDAPLTQAPHTMDKLPYDPRAGFTPLSLGGGGPAVLVVSDTVPNGSVREFVAYAKAHPGAISFASAGAGTSFHLYGEIFKRKTGIDMEHVPYKGAGDVGKDIVAGRVQMMFAAASGAVQFARSGKVKLLAATGTQRSDLLPGVPTLAELGYPGFDLDTWLAWFGPAKMDPQTVERLNALLRQAMSDPQVKERYRTMATSLQPSSPPELAAMVADSYKRWGEIVKQVGLPK